MKQFFMKNIISKAIACLNKHVERNHFESLRSFFFNLTICTKRYKASREQSFCQTCNKEEKLKWMPSNDNFMKKDKLYLFGFQYSLKSHPNYKERKSNYFASVEKDFNLNEHLLLIQLEVKKNKSWSNSSLVALTQELMKN
ncbi:hypothetical protein HMI54_004925 [Coelomomyces lativittatus]|nr:hypothetical protein HMI54_004925 [Coelomomyces lativittatus]KAJ1506745.1 hypothetical protein HMI55_001047 [Coelomomyces lativittatus]